MNNDLISRDALKEDITLLTAYRYELLSTEDIIDIIDNEVTKMNNDLISRSALKEEFLKYKPYAVDFLSLIDNAPAVKPCDNCDLYFKAMTKAAELDKMPMISKKHKGGADMRGENK